MGDATGGIENVGTAKEVAPIVKDAAAKGNSGAGVGGSKPGNITAPAAGAAAPAGSAPVRKMPGAKEVIPFEWKLLGDAHGLTFTLFKSVEREEVDAQMKRLEGDVYYTKLRIVSAESKVKQNATAVKAAVPPHSKLRADVDKKPKSKGKTRKTAKSSDTPTVIAIPRSEKFPSLPKAAKSAKRKRTPAKRTKKAKVGKVAKTAKAKVTSKQSKRSTKSTAATTAKKKTVKKTAPVKKTKTTKKKTTAKTTKKSVAKKKKVAKKKTKR